MNVNDLIKLRAKHIDAMSALVALGDLNAKQVGEYDSAKADVKKLDVTIARAKEVEAEMAKAARPVGGLYASAKSDPYERDPSLSVGGMIRMIAQSGGNSNVAIDKAHAQYGESHPVTKAMQTSKSLNTLSGSAGGFAVPPDFVDDMIPLLYARTVVRKAGAAVMPMPNGTMTIPKMTGGSTATWVGETKPISESVPAFGQVIATAHKLAALVPVSNDQLRYASPAFDGQIRDDVVAQIALAEDLAFIRGAGTAFSPRGLKSFALSTSVLTSTYAYTAITVNNELAGLVNKLEMSNLPLAKGGWLMSPRTKNYLLNLQNSQALYIYKEEMTVPKTLLGYPFYTTTAIPANLTVNSNPNCSEIYFVDFGSCMILESRQMEFMISMEGSYQDANGVMQSAVQNDLTIIRAIMAEDFQLRHDECVAIITGVAWANAIS